MGSAGRIAAERMTLTVGLDDDDTQSQEEARPTSVPAEPMMSAPDAQSFGPDKC